MLREYFTNRWILGGFCFLIVFALGCYVWYEHEQAKIQREEAANAALRRQVAVPPKVDTDTEAEPTTNAIAESITPIAETPINKTNDYVEEDTETSEIPINSTEQTEENENAKMVSVSPYGFGPYPELPDGWPVDTFPASSANHELISRVMIKLLAQGVNVIGAARDDSTGMIYPSIPGVVYIEWIETLQPDGSILRHAGRISGAPRTVQVIRDRASNNKDEPFLNLITENTVPKEIRVISHNDGGIDPYEFLGLKGE